MANYLIYPFKTMWISQNYNANGNPDNSHWWYSHGSPAGYPLDERGADYGRDWFYCPCDEVKVVKITGVGSTYTNTIWLESTSKVIFADLSTDYVTFMCIHPNDDDLKKIKVGQKFKRKEKMFREGTDGHATGNHIHFEVGKGKIKGSGWAQNNKGKWLLTTTGGAIKPEKAMAVDKDFTKVVNKAELSFKSLAMVEKAYKGKSTTETSTSKYPTGDYKVTEAAVLRVRKGAGLSYDIKKFKELTPTAQKKIEKIYGAPIDGYVKGLTFTVSKVTYNKTDKMYWGQTPSGWVALKYCRKV